jgi:hypothetical protein
VVACSSAAAQCGEFLVALDPAELGLGGEHPGRCPAQGHLARGPGLHPPGVVADDLDHALHRVGGLHGLQQLAAHLQPVDGQGLGQALAQAGGRAGPLAGQAAGQGLQLVLGLFGIGGGPGRAQPALDERPLGLRQVVEHVAFLVPAAPLDQGFGAEGAPDGGGQGLAAFDDEQHPMVGVQAAVTQPGHQPQTHRLVLGGALHHPERDLGAVGGHPERTDQQVLPHPKAVQEDHQPPLTAQRSVQQLVEPLGGRGHEPARDRRG